MIKAIIIDDERLARKRVRELLAKYPAEIQLVGEADNGATAIAVIEKEQPQLLFLDIQMPDMSGFEMLEQLSYQPRIIFTTAYQKYAIEAFEKLSIDYLVKPLTEERFDKAIEKLRLLQSDIKKEDVQQLLDLIKNQAKPKKTFSLPIKKGDKIILVDYEDIAYLNAADKYVNVVLINGQIYLSNKTMTQLEIMVPDTFIRVHRSYLINQNYIAEIEKYFKGTLILTLSDKNKTAIKTGETYSENVKTILGL